VCADACSTYIVGADVAVIRTYCFVWEVGETAFCLCGAGVETYSDFTYVSSARTIGVGFACANAVVGGVIAHASYTDVASTHVSVICTCGLVGNVCVGAGAALAGVGGAFVAVVVADLVFVGGLEGAFCVCLAWVEALWCFAGVGVVCAVIG